MKRGLIAAVRWYQRHISSHTNPRCRFTPTCSAYMIEAIERFGAVRGMMLGTWRILRCNPFGGHGYDPVPDTFTFRAKRPHVHMDDDEADALYDEDADR